MFSNTLASHTSSPCGNIATLALRPTCPMAKLTTTASPQLSSSSSSQFSPRAPLKLHTQPSRPPFPWNKKKPPSRRILCSPNSSPSDSFSLLSLLRPVTDWADAVKERGVTRSRSLYTADNWRDHRSSSRHLRHLLSSLSSRVILSVVPAVSVLTAIAAALSAYNSAVAAGALPPPLPLLHASSTPYQLAAPALALLLVFRTEASYSRFQEGRKAWMRVVATAGEMAGMVMSAAGKRDAGVKRALLNYIMAFPVALKCHVINGSDIEADLWNLLEEGDLAVVLSSTHRPRCVIEFISQSLEILHLEEPKRNILESKIQCFHEGLGVCEQLIGIPIPLSYTRLTSRLLVLWHLTLPIILWDDCNWFVVPATFMSAASLFCIEEVGVLIEEPFPMLALDELCKQLQDSIQEAMTLEKLVHRQLLAKVKIHPDECFINGWPHP